jgi:hypothetical protein
MLAHGLSYWIAASRLNRNIEDEQSTRRISMLFGGPRDIANFWRQLLNVSFLRSKDAMLIGAGVTHILTTVTILVLLVSMFVQDLAA